MLTYSPLCVPHSCTAGRFARRQAILSSMCCTFDWAARLRRITSLNTRRTLTCALMCVHVLADGRTGACIFRRFCVVGSTDQCVMPLRCHRGQEHTTRRVPANVGACGDPD